MSPPQIESNLKAFEFGKLAQRQVVADFSGGSITSDAGLVLLAQLDKQYEITRSFARGFKDERDQNCVQHALPNLIVQRVYGLVQGYPDLNDHEQWLCCKNFLRTELSYQSAFVKPPLGKFERAYSVRALTSPFSTPTTCPIRAHVHHLKSP